MRGNGISEENENNIKDKRMRKKHAQEVNRGKKEKECDTRDEQGEGERGKTNTKKGKKKKLEKITDKMTQYTCP